MPTTWHALKQRLDVNRKIDLSKKNILLFKRSFHRPTGLTADEQVWIVVTGVAVEAHVSLNGTPLGLIPAGESQAAFEITPRLNLRNELELRLVAEDISGDDHDRLVWESIGLEMRMPDEKPGTPHP